MININFPADLAKDQVKKSAERYLAEVGLTISSNDFTRPWGGFFCHWWIDGWSVYQPLLSALKCNRLKDRRKIKPEDFGGRAISTFVVAIPSPARGDLEIDRRRSRCSDQRDGCRRSAEEIGKRRNYSIETRAASSPGWFARGLGDNCRNMAAYRCYQSLRWKRYCKSARWFWEVRGDTSDTQKIQTWKKYFFSHNAFTVICTYEKY